MGNLGEFGDVEDVEYRDLLAVERSKVVTKTK